MKKQPERKEQPLLTINGHEATEKEYKRVLTPGARPSSKEDRATKPLHNVVHGFQLLK